jgi:hypothetical protein
MGLYCNWLTQSTHKIIVNYNNKKGVSLIIVKYLYSTEADDLHNALEQ